MPRTILVHLNIELPDDSDATVEQILASVDGGVIDLAGFPAEIADAEEI